MKLRLLFLVACATAISASAQVPGILSHQGKITVNSTNFNGAGQFKFALVDASGTNTLWSNNGTSVNGAEPTGSAVPLSVTRGIFSVNLGDADLANMTQFIPAAVFTNSEVYLRVWFNDGVNGSQQLQPDRRITSVGYAMVAGSYAETDPLFAASAAHGIQAPDIASWNARLKGGGTANHVGKFTGDDTIGNSAIVESAGFIGIGVGNPSTALDVAGDVNVTGQFRINGTPIGATGPQGPVGATGATGDAGPRGLEGAQGVQGTQGEQGATGAQGPAGLAGANGLDGKTVLNGLIAPTAQVGADGDFYIDTATSMIYGPKASGEWPGGVALVGPQGPTGATGAAGSQGPEGQIGATGATGAAGPRGLEGAQGVQGTQGEQGATGAQGPAGLAGANGLDGKTVLNGLIAPTAQVGADGDFYIDTATSMIYGPKASGEWPAGVALVGPQGPTGATGAAGSQGPEGQIGATGATGAAGPRGLEGAQGVQGTQGEQGATGAQGPAGLAGANGLDGKTVLNGLIAPTAQVGADGDFYIDTATSMIYGPKASGEWPGGVALVGPQGPTGATGAAGPRGLEGAQGVQGTQGEQGATGAQGPAGLAGANGLDGKTVLNGLIAPTAQVGADGDFYIDTATSMIYGPKASGEWPGGVALVGPQGPTGATGAAGSQGPEGQIGATGATGAAGPRGLEGAQGVQGTQGEQGATGAQGPAGLAGANGLDGKTVLNGLIAPTAQVGADGDFYIDTVTSMIYGPKASGEWPAGVALVGPQGPTGATGAAGSQGPEGQIGATGATGAAGPRGLEGAQGQVGATGTQGPAGVDGTNGVSPFELSGTNANYTTGNVGIGTTSPTERLHVVGNMIIASNLTVLGTITALEVSATATNLWEDLRFTPQELNPSGTPSAAVLSSAFGPNSNKLSITFAETGTQCMFVNAQLSHEYVTNTTIFPHVHVSPNTTASGNVVFVTRYSWVNIGGTFPSETVVTNVVSISGSDRWKHLMVNLPPEGVAPDAASGNVSSMLCIRMERQGDNILDTYPVPIDVLEYDIHYRSRGEPVAYVPTSP